MNVKRRNTTLTIVIAVIAVGLIIAAALLYPRLSKQVRPDPDAGLVQTTAGTESQMTDQATDDQTTAGQTDQTNQPDQTDQTDAPDYSAPEITLTNNLGQTHSLSDFAGKTVVLNFWASWCPPCREEMPDFETVYKETGANSEEVIFMMINGTFGQETKADADSYYAENGFTFPYYYDSEAEAANTYTVSAFPTTIIVTSEGELFSIQPGMLPDADALRGLIEASQTFVATGELPG